MKDQSKKLKPLKDVTLLQPSAVKKLSKIGIDNADSLFLYIRVEREKISKTLNLSLGDVSCLGIFLLEWVSKDTLILLAERSLENTEKPVKISKGR